MAYKSEKTESKMIQASELFCCHSCIKCDGYLTVTSIGIKDYALGNLEPEQGIVIELQCLSCGYETSRLLV